MKKINGGFTPYNHDKCVVCGKCLIECPVMRLPEAEAKKEISALRAGREGKHVLWKCETCMACNISCPNAARPMSLFLDSFYSHHKKKGFPAWSRYFQPHEPVNFRTTVIDKMPKDEKALLEKWKDLSPCGEFVFPGCNLCTAPYLTQAEFLKGLNIRGGLEYCCGEMYYRTGMFDQLRATAAHLDRWLETLGAKKMMILCTAGYNLFSNILPSFGLKSDIEVTSYLPWLWEKIEKEEIMITRRLNMSVTIQESCHAKNFGQEYYGIPRKILDRIGVDVIEMPNHGENAYCCGIGGGFPPKKLYHPLAVTRSTVRFFNETRKTGADAVMTYCAGCMLSLSSLTGVVPGSKPVYHLFELIQMASGKKLPRRNLERGRAMLAGTMKHQLPSALSQRKIRPPEVPGK